MTDEELDGKLESLTEEDIENLEGDELCELVERVYGEQEEDEDDEEPEKPELKFKLRNSETHEQGLARIAMEPEVRAAVSMLIVNNPGFDQGAFDLTALIEELNRQTVLIKNKDLSRAEEMLTVQTHTLDLLFNRLAVTAEANISEGYLEAANTYLKLAMKAQAQCRTTWEAVAKIQNPPVINVTRQTNIAKNQQINNGQEIENPPNELSEVNHELLPDKRDAGTT
ncbi:MAG TPA: hypothetical protein EYP19_04550, partial [Desulfobacterales bacterium]|nr:hypothetical protein [Desulfobacterales bacterium]